MPHRDQAHTPVRWAKAHPTKPNEVPGIGTASTELRYTMKLADLEKDVLLDFFQDMQIDSTERVKSLDEIEVLDRDIRGTGAIVSLIGHRGLRIGPPNMSLKGGGIAAYINKDRML